MALRRNKVQKAKNSKSKKAKKSKKSNAGIKKKSRKQDGIAAPRAQQLEKDLSKLPAQEQPASGPASMFPQESAGEWQSTLGSEAMDIDTEDETVPADDPSLAAQDVAAQDEAAPAEDFPPRGRPRGSKVTTSSDAAWILTVHGGRKLTTLFSGNVIYTTNPIRDGWLPHMCAFCGTEDVSMSPCDQTFIDGSNNRICSYCWLDVNIGWRQF